MKNLLLVPLLWSTGCLSPSEIDATLDAEDGVTIYDIRLGRVDDGQPVVLDDVVATSDTTLSGDGFFVQDPQGGPYSGVFVSHPGIDLDVKRGDKLDLTGLFEAGELDRITVEARDQVSVIGTGTVSASGVGLDEDWEQWESVVVTVSDVKVQSGALDIGGGLAIGQMLYEVLAETDDTFDSVTGPIGFEGGHTINPRGDLDLDGYRPGGGGGGPKGNAISEIQQGKADGIVTFEGVVTTPVVANGTGFFVQDSGGGQWSGVFVFVGGGADDIQPGDVVEVTGQVGEYYDFTQVDATKGGWNQIGTGKQVSVTVLDGPPSDWEPYEGVLVGLNYVDVDSDPNKYGEAETSYDILLDDLIYTYDAGDGESYGSVTGAINYAYGEYRLCPRSADDFADDPLKGGSDGGGGDDGGDDGGGDGGGGDTVSVYEIQNGGIKGDVRLEGVVVSTPPTYNDAGFFVQDSGGGEWSGIFVYTGGDVTPEVGDILNLEGSVSEYYDFTELDVSVPETIEIVGKATPTAVTLSASPGDWEPYEGVLVELEGLSTTGATDSYGETATDFGGVVIDDLFHDYGDLSSGVDFVSVTGAINYSYSQFKVCPRDAADLVQ